MVTGRAFPIVAVIVVAMTLVLASCSEKPTDNAYDAAPSISTQMQDRPPGFDVTFRWLGNDDLNLFSPMGTFVRAYVESFYLANEGQSTAWGYPGFIDASTPDIRDRVRDLPSESADGGLVGTSVFVAASREDRGDRTRFILCEYGFASSGGFGGRGVWTNYVKSAVPTVIGLRRSGQVPPADQRGAVRGPQRSVFGGWHVDEFEFIAVGGRFSAEMEICRTQPIPEGVVSEDFVPGQRSSSPRPPEPQYPGWPAHGL